jgi:hypothetical protein
VNYDDFSKETRSDFWREVSGCFEKILRRKLLGFMRQQMSSSEFFYACKSACKGCNFSHSNNWQLMTINAVQ